MEWMQGDRTRPCSNKMSCSVFYGNSRTKVRFLKLGPLSTDKAGVQLAYSANTQMHSSVLATTPKDRLDTCRVLWFQEQIGRQQEPEFEVSALNIQGSQSFPSEIKQKLDPVNRLVSVEGDLDLSRVLKREYFPRPTQYKEETVTGSRTMENTFEVLLLSEEEDEENGCISHDGIAPVHIQCEMSEETVASAKQMGEVNQTQVSSEINKTSSCPNKRVDVKQRTKKLAEDDEPLLLETDSMNIGAPSGISTWIGDDVISMESSPKHLQSLPQSASLGPPLDGVSNMKVVSELRTRAALFFCVCGAGFLDKQLFDDHTACHSSDKILLCSYCHQLFPDGLKFNKHLLLHQCY